MSAGVRVQTDSKVLSFSTQTILLKSYSKW